MAGTADPPSPRLRLGARGGPWGTNASAAEEEAARREGRGVGAANGDGAVRRTQRTPSGSAPVSRIAAAGGTREVRLVEQTCAPGGLRVPLNGDQLKAFFDASTSLDAAILAEALLGLVCAPPDSAPNAWHAQVRALCIIDEARVRARNGGGAAAAILAYVQAEREVVAALATDAGAHPTAQAKAREVAANLGGGDATAATAAAAAAAAAAPATAAPTATAANPVDLLAGLDHVPPPAAPQAMADPFAAFTDGANHRPPPATPVMMGAPPNHPPYPMTGFVPQPRQPAVMPPPQPASKDPFADLLK